jgi:hypothetical protein
MRRAEGRKGSHSELTFQEKERMGCNNQTRQILKIEKRELNNKCGRVYISSEYQGEDKREWGKSQYGNL